MSERVATSVPVPHRFMVLSIVSFAVLALAPSAAPETDPTAAGPGHAQGVVMAMDASAPALSSVATRDVQGHPGSAAVTVGALAALLGLLTATFRAGRMRPHGAGRPILGLFAGLLAGAAGAASPFSLGVISLVSPAWVYLPLVLATLVTALGVTAPFGQATGRELQMGPC